MYLCITNNEIIINRRCNGTKQKIMNALERLSNDLHNEGEWDSVRYVYCPVISAGLSSNVRIFEDYVFDTESEAEDFAKELIDDGYLASNNMPALDYSSMKYKVNCNGYKGLGLTGFIIYK